MPELSGPIIADAQSLTLIGGSDDPTKTIVMCFAGAATIALPRFELQTRIVTFASSTSAAFIAFLLTVNAAAANFPGTRIYPEIICAAALAQTVFPNLQIPAGTNLWCSTNGGMVAQVTFRQDI